MNSRRTNDLAGLVRGAVVGALGGPLLLVGVVLSDKLRLGYVPYGGLLEISAVPTFVLVGAVFGSVVAIIFWTLARKAIYPSAVVRVVIGSAIPLTFVTVLNFLRSGENSGLNPPTPTEAITNGLLYIVCFGALPGIAAYAKTERTKPNVDDAT